MTRPAITTSAVIVAGGQGTRLGSPVPKAFISLGRKPMFLHSVEVFLQHPSVNRIVLVAHRDMAPHAQEYLGSFSLSKPVEVVVGGAERWISARNGVAATPAQTEWVLIHDAARPFITTAVIDRILAKAPDYRCVVTATPISDTVREIQADSAGKTVDRSKLVRVGTPQLFHRQTLTQAFEAAENMPSPPTDEAVLMEQMGVAVGIAWGDPVNFKITTQEDLHLAELIADHKEKMRVGGK